MQAWKILIPGTAIRPELRMHEGTEWLYVLSGEMRLILGNCDLILTKGEVVDFDTRVSHWFGSADGQEAEILSLLGRQASACTPAPTTLALGNTPAITLNSALRPVRLRAVRPGRMVKAGVRGSTSRIRAVSSSHDLDALRTCANDNGYAVSSRGRVSAQGIEAYANVS